MAIRATMTKEEVNELSSLATFDGQIEVIEKEEEIEPAIAFLSQHKEVGFDTETKPSFSRGESNEVALLQISTLEKAFLFRVCITGITEPLKKFIEDDSTMKIGLSLQDDFRAMRRRTHGLEPAMFVDLQKICPAYGIEEQSLRSIYAILFEEKMSKQARLTNWEAAILPEKAIQYAALDAYSCLRIYYQLLTLPSPDPYKFGLMPNHH